MEVNLLILAVPLAGIVAAVFLVAAVVIRRR